MIAAIRIRSDADFHHHGIGPSFCIEVKGLIRMGLLKTYWRRMTR
jgi:hypothetical protein